MMKWYKCHCLLPLPVGRGRHGKFYNIPLCFLMGFPDLSVANYIQIFNFTGASMPHECSNSIPSSIPVPLPRPSLLSTLTQWWEWCQGATTSNIDERMRERESHKDRCRARHRITVRVEIWLCIKAKPRGKKLPLKLIICPWEEKPQPLPPSFSLCVVCLMVPTVYMLPVLTFTQLSGAIKASFEWLNAAFHIVLHIFLCPEALLFDIQTTYPKATVIVTETTDSYQRVNSLETRLDMFFLWSLTACFIFVDITLVNFLVGGDIFSSLELLA